METLSHTTSILPLQLPPYPTRPNALSAALSSATSLLHIKQVHAQILRSKFERSDSDSLLFKLILSSCALSPSLDYALSVFDQIPEPKTRFCNKLLRELSRGSEPENALFVYEKMRAEGLSLDRFCFPPLLKAASRNLSLRTGMEIHGLASKLGFGSDPFVETGLIRMYAACRRIMEARLVFDKMSQRDVVTWSIMIDGYCLSGYYDLAFQLFEEMKRTGLEPDEMILSTILSACARAGNLDFGTKIHEFITKKNIVMDPHLQSALIKMYASYGSTDLAWDLYEKISPKNMVISTAMVSGLAKGGQIGDARYVFDQMVEKDLICWSAMISGYTESDCPQEALVLFKKMQQMGMKPDVVTMLSVISACAHLGALDQAKWIQIYVDKNGFGKALSINNALIDMYAKCGSLEGAREIFGKMPKKNVISWTSMINALAMHGDAHNALSLFHQMKVENVEPNWITFVGLLYACSHGGLVKEGQRIFHSMINEYGISPKHEHFGCMVDLFGRAKLLREALEVVEAMPFAPNAIIWGSLMAACQLHSDTELGEFAAKQVLKLEPDHDGALVVLSNIYAKERRWEDAGEVRKLMNEMGVSKERGCSRIELNNEVHEFQMADRKHKQADLIYHKLNEVVQKLKLAGYTPQTNCVLVDLDEEEKKELVLWHSEKLALCYALMNEGSRICITKNLRICEDCHAFMKLASKVYAREIVVRDRTRFHHYRDGSCSCKDYW
ncbi:pentatricopeptide repeat-containing protein At4g14820-like isoform X1 [Cucurbita maxima]|uniref:Pentatricopeptide repeat-containing protein At4g14820-like n=1 Tax=Cucurbita maxima TaxID=3661 RepID=A0A6J1IE29_CUCMA|nr:pentatricopeptide repeat-containing protein At4g14820-like [Cucurbita maxima]XP_022975405.1 pentatricopeptide repeat-containing protein At4g14820-like isoform X1 [Cucurbita maxima]XP_022975406.1 pentatricopeptide repeat-containing protein At4g14820-like isoform X1 [Cucurbita maxima]